MLEDNLARAIEACSCGRRVTITLASGKTYRFPILAQEPEAPAPDPLDVLSRQLLERDAAVRSAVDAVKDAVATVAAGQVDLAQTFEQGVKEIVGTLHLPVVPTKYDKDGRIAEARRKEKP